VNGVMNFRVPEKFSEFLDQLRIPELLKNGRSVEVVDVNVCWRLLQTDSRQLHCLVSAAGHHRSRQWTCTKQMAKWSGPHNRYNELDLGPAPARLFAAGSSSHGPRQARGRY